MRKITKRTAAVVAGGALAVATAGTAFAFWSTSGSGTGSGGTTATGSVKLSYATSTTIAPMYPGDKAQNFSVTVKNTSTTQKGYVAGIKAYITTDKTGCTGADYVLNSSTTAVDAGSAVALNWNTVDLAPGTSQDSTLNTIQFNDTGANQDACQGATVTLNYASN